MSDDGRDWMLQYAERRTAKRVVHDAVDRHMHLVLSPGKESPFDSAHSAGLVALFEHIGEQGGTDER